MTVQLIVIGLVVGFLVGLSGVGGASIMTPLLVALRVDPLVAVGSDLTVNAVTKFYGAYLHRRQGTVNISIVRALCLGGLPGLAVGVAGLVYARHALAAATLELWIRHAIGIMVVIAAALMIYSRLKLNPTAHQDGTPMWDRGRRGRTIATGFFVGVVVAATSIGGGSVTLPLLLLTLPSVAACDLVGSDVMFAAILVPLAALAHWRMGNVDLPLSLNLLAGCLPGVFIGSRLCRAWNNTWLRPAVAIILAYAGFRLILV